VVVLDYSNPLLIIPSEIMLSSNMWVKFSLAIGLLLSAGCVNTTESGANFTSNFKFTGAVTSVRNLQQNQAVGTTIHLRGKVGAHAPLLGGQVYELTDETGKIWVLTQEKPPNPGDEVVIKGQVRFKSIPLNGKEQGSVYIEQQEQVEHTPAKTISS
jgi:hypothetical protein